MLAAQVDRLVVDAAVGEAGKASYQLWAQVRNRGAQQLTLTLPAGFELAAGSRDGTPVVPGADGSALAVPLLTQEAPQVVHLGASRCRMHSNVNQVADVRAPRGAVQLPMPRAPRSKSFHRWRARPVVEHRIGAHERADSADAAVACE